MNPRGEEAANLSRQIRNNERISNPRGEEITDPSRIHRGDEKLAERGATNPPRLYRGEEKTNLSRSHRGDEKIIIFGSRIRNAFHIRFL